MRELGMLCRSARPKRNRAVKWFVVERRRMKQAIARVSLPIASIAASAVLVGCSNAATTTSNAATKTQTIAATQTMAPSPLQASTSRPSAVTPTAPQATLSVFTSAQYGYTLVLPAGWSSKAATARWDGDSIIHSDAPNVDQFYAAGVAGSWASAASYPGTLTSYVAKTIADTAKYHGTTCTAPPEAQLSIAFGEEPGTLLQFNCRILINIAVTVHDGVGYSFGFRDPTVHAAVDQADQAVFEAILASTQFPA